MSTTADRWSAWLHVHRCGGDAEKRRELLEQLAPVRDRVLDGAGVRPGDLLLDVGCGDGLIGLGALDRGADVIFSDVSQSLLDDCRRVAGASARYVLAPATDLSAIEDASVDVVTTRSVLIYVEDKPRALGEFHRVLRPGGRLSIFEPVNRFGHPDPESRFCGYDASPVRDLADKVIAAWSDDAEATMMDFDERDLLQWAEEAGFAEIRLDYEATIGTEPWLRGPWETVLQTAGNPLAPTLGEAIEAALTPAEAERFTGHLRPLVERGDGRSRMAKAYLVAVKR